MSNINKMYEGVQYGIGLIDMSKPISMDDYTRYRGRFTWNEDSSIKFTFVEDILVISSKMGKHFISQDDIESVSVKMDSKSDITVIIECLGNRFTIHGKMSNE